jgi:TRAP-type C4-dicarboxylate transport system permease small subunit
VSLLSTVDKYNRYLITGLEWIGSCALFTMMVITCVNVIGAKIFLVPVFGVIDIVQICQVVAASFACGSALIFGRHVQVDFFVVMFPKRVQAAINIVVDLLGIFLFAVIVWRVTLYGHYMQTGREVSATARIPLYPFAYGVALGSLPVCLVLLSQLITSLSRTLKK